MNSVKKYISIMASVLCSAVMAQEESCIPSGMEVNYKIESKAPLNLMSGPTELSKQLVSKGALIGDSPIKIIGKDNARLLCQKGEWVKIRVKNSRTAFVEMEGWIKDKTVSSQFPSIGNKPPLPKKEVVNLKSNPIASLYVESAKASALSLSSDNITKPVSNDKFTEKDFEFDNATRKYKKLIIAGVNKVYREDAKCADVDPKSAYISGSKSTPQNPAFYVLCLEGRYQAYFSKSDIENNNRLVARKSLDKWESKTLCVEKAKSRMIHPSTFQWQGGEEYVAHDNGNASYVFSFSGRNSYNTLLKWKIRCVVEHNKNVSDTIQEIR